MKRTPTLRVDDHEWLCLMDISSLLAETLHQSEELITASRRTIWRALEQWISEGRLHPLEPETLNPWDHQTDEVPGYFVLERNEVENFAQAHGVTLTRTDPTPILISDRLETITVGRAKELIIDAADCPNEVCEDGMTALEAFVERMEQDLTHVCKSLGIQSRHSHNSLIGEASKDSDHDSRILKIEDFVRYANFYGVPVTISSSSSSDNDHSLVPSIQLKSRMECRREQILSKIKELGFNPQALPPWSHNAKGVKSMVKDALGDKGIWAQKKSMFPKAWQSLLDDDELKYVKRK